MLLVEEQIVVMEEIQELKEEMEPVLAGVLLKIMEMMGMLIQAPEVAEEMDVQLQVLEGLEVPELLY